MASTEAPSFYLPSLDKCLNGGHTFISWERAHAALSNLALAKRSPNLQLFLKDERSISALSSDLGPRTPPNSQTKSDFENRTAAINVAPSRNGHFDIQQIKDDVLWLSKQIGIDEVSALRIVVIEWQERPAAKILESCTEEEGISLQQSVGDKSFGASLSTTFDRPSTGSQNDFDSDANRRLRLVRTFLSEHQYMLGVSCILSAAALPASSEPSAAGGSAPSPFEELPWLEDVLESLNTASSGKQKSTNSERRLQAAVEDMKIAIEGWSTGANWTQGPEIGLTLESTYRSSQLARIFLVLKLLCIHVSSLQTWASASSVQTWFEFIDMAGFFEALQPQTADQQGLIEPIQALACTITLQMLRLPQALEHIRESAPHGRPVPFIYDEACREQVNKTLANAASTTSPIASLALLAWSIILQETRGRVMSLDSDDDASLTDGSSPMPARRQTSANAPQALATALDAVLRSMPEGDVIDYYGTAAVVGCSVLAVTEKVACILKSTLMVAWSSSPATVSILSILQLLRQATLLLEYTGETIQPFLTLLKDETDYTAPHHRPSPVRAAVAEAFLGDREILVPRLLHQAQMRYPAEMAPLLELAQTVTLPGNARYGALKGVLLFSEPRPFFCQRLPNGFQGFETTREEENAGIIRLTEDIPLFLPRRSFGVLKTSDSRSVVVRGDDDAPLFMHIPAGTTGRIVSEDKPYIVQWDHQHSVIQYLTCLLASETPSSRYRDASNDGVVDPDVQASIISLFARLVEARTDSHDDPGEAKEFLEEASENLPRNEDIVSVVFDIFNEHLSQGSKLIESSAEVVTSCLDFFRIILPVVPGRIWPLLARGEILGVDGSGGRLAAAITSIDGQASSVKVVSASIAMTDALVRDVVANAATVKDAHRSRAKRFKGSDQSSGIPPKLTGKIASSLTQVLLNVVEGSQSWHVESEASRHQIRLSITALLRYLLERAYGCSEAGIDTDVSLCAVLVPAARLTLETFFGVSTSSTFSSRLWSTFIFEQASNPLLASPLTPASSVDSIVPDLFSTLLGFAPHSDSAPSRLLRTLFRASPLIARSYVLSDVHKPALLRLLATMVRTAGTIEADPPSLLGGLGESTAKAFLQILQGSGSSVASGGSEFEMWTLAADIVSNKQQWATSILINGDTPKGALRSKRDHDPNNNGGNKKALLHAALETLGGRPELHSKTSIAMLRFLVQCQNNRPLVSQTIRNTTGLLDKLLDYASVLRTDLSKDEPLQAEQTSAATHIAELLAMYIHNMRQLGSLDDVDRISSKLGFYRENGVALPDYNSSLHSNLKRNFEKRFAGCTLDSFKRNIPRTDYGRQYYYDLDFAGEIFGQHRFWTGDKGFEGEIARANINLSLVESQVRLMRSWEFLVTELSKTMEGRDGLQKQMINVANHCLVNNVNSPNVDLVILEELTQRRADLALVIIRHLVSVRCKASTFKTLLSPAWDMARGSTEDFEVAFVDGNGTYCRTALQVLLLSLQPHTYIDDSRMRDSANASSERPRDKQPEAMPILVEIASTAVCTGFRGLCSSLHNAPASVDLSDLALLIGLLQTILRIPNISTAYNTLSLRISETGIHRYALALFSWSDKLMTATTSSTTNEATITRALTIADLTTSLIQTLATIPPYAEYLATESTLSQLASAPLLSYLRPSSNHNQTQQSPELLRLQLTWSNNILPLVLNILTAVGPTFAPEASAFLLSFPEQLMRAAAALSPSTKTNTRDPFAGVITLATAREVHALSLLMLGIARSQASAPAYVEQIIEQLRGHWDSARVREDAEGWLGGRREELRERIRPMSEWEEEMVGRDAKGLEGCENGLELAVVRELRGVVLGCGGDA